MTNIRTRSPLLRIGALALSALLAACTAPSPQATQQPAVEPAASSQPAPATPPSGAPSLGTPAAKPGKGGAPVALDRSCQTDADCAVKDVGNCCGYFPACVNQNSPTDPARVKAQCEASGMASVCGFQEISACTCTAGKCEAADGGAPVAQ